MPSRTVRAALLVALALAPAARAEDGLVPQGDKEPVLVIKGQGPTALVNAVAFSPDGRTLYAAGFDKAVHAWTLNNKGEFVPSPTAYRVPIGPGVYGAINCLAVSPDGRWLAAAGKMLLRGLAEFRRDGIVLDRALLTDAQRLDEGTVYVFDTATGDVRPLRGHRGQVRALAFTPSDPRHPDKAPLLVSAAEEWDRAKGAPKGGVRVWDVSAKEPLVAASPDLPAASEDLQVGLAPWHAGARPEQVRVALAWQKGRLYVWDVAREKLLRAQDKEEGEDNDSAAYLVKAGQLVTGSFKNPDGQLQLWDLPDKDGFRPVVGAAARFERTKAPPWTFYYPRALAAFPPQKGAVADHLALALYAVEVDNNGKKTAATSRLRLLKVEGDKLRDLRRDVPLWPETENSKTVLAADPTGRHLVAAGSAGHELLVFSVESLLQGKDEPKQRLQGVGTSARYAAFVTKGKARGLLLNTQARETPGQKPRPPKAGDVVFDFGENRLTDKVTDWKPEGPDLGGWEVTHERKEKEPFTVIVRQNGREVQRFPLKPEQRLSAYALLPKAFDAPVLAVAFDDRGETRLVLYNAKTGELLRACEGHVQPVASLAFSADGKLLASAGLDQTVCVWSLADLGKTLGRLGTVRGLVIHEKDGGGLEVGHLDADRLSPVNKKALADAKVAVGDVFEGLVVENKLEEAKTARGLYHSLARFQPGQKVTLRFKGRGDVALTLDQGADGRKPLFSLFLTRPRKEVADVQWVGWSPIGPYDASDGDAERLLGWHRNTGEADKPTKFADAKAFRDDNYKQGILADLVATANTADALLLWEKRHPPRAKVPVTALVVSADGAGPKDLDQAGRPVLQGKELLLSLRLTNTFPPEKVGTVTWQVERLDAGGGKPVPVARGEFQAGEPRQWAADLSKLDWQRGGYRITALMKLEAGEHAPAPLTVAYQPPRPVLTPREAIYLKSQEKPGLALKDLKITVAPGKEGQKVKVNVVHLYPGGQKHLVKDKVTDGPFPIDMEVTLEPGANQVKVVAENAGAAGEDAARERAWLPVHVVYDKKEPRPIITLTEVIPLPDGERRAVEPGAVAVVDGRRVRVRGEVRAEADLARAARADDPKAAGELLKGFKEKAGKTFAIDEVVELKGPGEKTFYFRAKTAYSEEAVRELTLDFRPRLPAVRVLAPPDETKLYEGRDKRQVKLKAKLDWPEDKYPCRAVLVIDGKPQGKPIEIAAGKEDLAAEAELPAGASRHEVQVRLTNEWKAEALTPAAAVHYLRPPEVLSLEVKRQGPKTLVVDVFATVRSPADLELTGVRLNDSELSDSAWKRDPNDKALWKVEVRNRGVEVGKNTFRLFARNREAESLGAKEFTLEVAPLPPPARPVLTVAGPRDSATTAEKYKLDFRVRSESALTAVEVLDRDGQAVYHAVGLDKLPKAGDEYVLAESPELPLALGPNTFRLRAVNAGGEADDKVAVTRLPEPVRVFIDKLVIKGPGRIQELEHLSTRDGLRLFSAAEQSTVLVQGRVVWTKENDAAMARVERLRVFVNGAQSLQGKLGQPGAEGNRRVRPFEATVLLTRPKENLISVQLPGPDLKPDASSVLRCQVDCAKPDKDPSRRAHLLVIDVRPVNPKLVRDQALQAIQGEMVQGSPNEFTRAGFADGGVLYKPLTGDKATKQKITGQIQLISEALVDRARGGAVNDVVLVYYQGDETPDVNDHLLGGNPDSDPLSFKELTNQFGETFGTLILLLDVKRQPAKAFAREEDKDQVSRWDYDPHLSLLRYSRRADLDKAAPLLADLEDSVKRSARLGDVWNEMDKKFQPLDGFRFVTDRYPGLLVYDRHLADGPQDVALKVPK